MTEPPLNASVTGSPPASLLIRDLIQVPPVRTVIRLEEGRTQPEFITQSFVVTPEVGNHLSVLSQAFLNDQGRGFFLQGDFGSGKSHFLAVLCTWLANHAHMAGLYDRHQPLGALAAADRKILPVDVSLVKFRAGTPLEKILVEQIERALPADGPSGGLTPRARFFHAFRHLVADEVLAQTFSEQTGIAPDEIETVIVEDPRRAYREAVAFMKRIGLEAPETLVEERHETFARVMAAVQAAGYDGLALVIDELSEFFRSKKDARALNEDARTLQFLGELAQRQPLWIIAAVQESIERTGDIGQATLRKIKDRFPIKLSLSTVHIRALIAERLVRPKAGLDTALQQIYTTFCRQFPSFTWRFDEFRAYYPVHPVTIRLLDGLGDLFSEHRGIVDFVYAQVAGDPQRHINGILDRPCHELLGPDAIYDHFHPRMAEYSDLHIYPRHIVPHLDETIDHALEEPEDRVLAKRIVRVLVLYAIHPTAETPGVRELTEQVCCTLSDQDPSVNVEFVAGVILDPLVASSRYLVKKPGPAETAPDAGASTSDPIGIADPTSQADPLNVVYRVVTEGDPAKTLQARIDRRAEEIPADDSRLLAVPLADLPESIAWPGPHFLTRTIQRHIIWRQSRRCCLVVFIPPGGDPEDALGHKIRAALDSGEADFSVAIGFGRNPMVMAHACVWQVLAPAQTDDLAILRLCLAAQMVAADLKSTNPADVPLLQPAREAVDKYAPAAQGALLNTIYGGRFDAAEITVDPVVRRIKRFDRLLEAAGEQLLEARFPGFKLIAPQKVVPTPRLYHRLIDEFIFPGRLSLQKAHSGGLSDAIEGLAKPLGLVELQSGAYLFMPDPDNHPLLSALFQMIGTTGGTPLEEVVQNLRTGRFGVPLEMAHFLLTALAFGGLITLLKKGRPVALELLRIAAPASADSVAPGGIIGRHDRETLTTECTFLSLAGGSFGMRQQREAWQQVVGFRKWATKINTEIQTRLTAIAEFSAFETLDREGLAGVLRDLQAVADGIKVSYSAREGLERFLKAWRDSGLTGDRVEFIKNVRTFLANRAEHFVFVNHYLRHRAIAHAVAEAPHLVQYRDQVLDLIRQPEALMAADDPKQLTVAFERFREQYADYYLSRHGRYYRHLADGRPSAYAKRAHELLKRLTAIDALDRPHGLETVLKNLEQSHQQRPAACKRNLAEELMRAPVCSCGFMPESAAPVASASAQNGAVEDTLQAYLKILSAPEVREAVAARTFALQEADPQAVERLRGLKHFLDNDRPTAAGLLDVLDDTVARQLGKALASRTPITRRSLGELARKLEGRRLSAGQVLAVVREWLDDPAEEAVLAIDTAPMGSAADDRANQAPGSKPGSKADSELGSDSDPTSVQVPDAVPGPAGGVDWWLHTHPELFAGKVPDQPPVSEANLEMLLENRFPAADLLSNLERLDDSALLSFIQTEPFHTTAIRAAWRLLAERIVNGNPWPAAHRQAAIKADSETAVAIDRRLQRLESVSHFNRQHWPGILRTRIVLADLLVDSWTTAALRRTIFKAIAGLERRGLDWLETLPAPAPLDPTQNAMVVVFDGVSPDVWLETDERLKKRMPLPEPSWARLATAPQTPAAMAALFGFETDALEGLAVSGAAYYQVQGDEAEGLRALLPQFAPEQAVVIRVAMIDSGAHKHYLRLGEMPEAIGRFLGSELGPLQAICRAQNRELVITTDHGLSLTPKGLTHGGGGVFETAVFRLRWRYGEPPE